MRGESDMKTNREIYVDKLNNSSTEEFVKLVNAYQICSRCSNAYWDGNQTICHKNINKSSCEKGQEEYFESYSNEDLQEKYNKKYHYCKGYKQAKLLKELVQIIYYSGVVEWNGVDQCEICKNKGKKCYSTYSNCLWPFQHLLNIHSDYIKEKVKELNDFDKLCFRDKMTFDVWMKDILIPSILDKDINEKANRLCDILIKGDV